MKNIKALLGEWIGLIVASIATACCLGISAIIAAVTAIGLGFLIRDVYLFPIFVISVLFSLWILFRSCRRHKNLLPFWLGLLGGIVGMGALGFMITGMYAMPWLIYVGLIFLVIASIWDFVNRWFATEPAVCEMPRDNKSKQK